jgi:hypothetical protein
LTDGKLEVRNGDKTGRECPSGARFKSTDGVEINALLDGAAIVVAATIGENIIVLVDSSNASMSKLNIEESKLEVLVAEIKTVDLEFLSRRTIHIASGGDQGGDILNGKVNTLVLKLVLKVRSKARSIVVVVGMDGELSEGADGWVT